MKTIFHVDMDAFFVSVEEIFDPSLKGKAVVVGGPANTRGVVSAASYEARKFGVHSAMPLRTAFQKCPHAIFLDGHRERYVEYSRKVESAMRAFTPLVDMASIDEAYLDVTGTGRLHGSPLAAGHKLHESIKYTTGLNCSIGISTSRLVSKICSDQAKPNGIFWVVPGTEAQLLAPLDVRKIPGVGKKTEEALHLCGIRKIGDLAALDSSFLERRFGKWGLALAGKAHGFDAGAWFDTSFIEGDDPKSISHEHTFDEDTNDRARLIATLAHLSEMVGRRLRDHGLFTRTVQLKLRDEDFNTITRAHTLPQASQLDTEIFAEAKALFERNWNRGAVRLLGVQASNLEAFEGQANLLDQGKKDRWRSALSAADRLREKFGDDSVSLAAGLQGRFRRRVDETSTQRLEPEKKNKPKS
ncbi:MAG: DNA polymerase IV [Acidobacteriota bacterium]